MPVEMGIIFQTAHQESGALMNTVCEKHGAAYSSSCQKTDRIPVVKINMSLFSNVMYKQILYI